MPFTRPLAFEKNKMYGVSLPSPLNQYTNDLLVTYTNINHLDVVLSRVLLVP